MGNARTALPSRTAWLFRYVIHVEDTGPGISSETLATLFQLDDDSGTVQSGSGLRLTMSHRMCRLLGGEMKCESTLGKGTRIIFSLTFGKTGHADGEPSSALLLPGAQGKSVLVVATDARLRHGVAGKVAGFGFTTRSVASLAEMAQLDEQGQSASVTIVCPSLQASNPTTGATVQASGGGDDLDASIRAIGARPGACGTSLLLCPITQLGQAAEVRRKVGAVYCISSRPVRLSALSGVLEACLDNSFMRLPSVMLRDATEELSGAGDDDMLLGGSSSTAQVNALRILVAVSPELKAPLRALLVAGKHSCEICSSGNEVKMMVTDMHGAMVFDCLVVDHALLGTKGLLALVKDLQHMQRRAPGQRRLAILALVDAEAAQDTNIIASGVHSVITKPLTRLNLQYALASSAAAAATCKGDKGGASDAVHAAALHSGAAPAPASAAAAVAAHAVQEGGEETGVKRVLVVDDDAGQQRVLKSILSKDNFEVELTKDVAAAMAAAAKSRFHLVVLKAAMAGKPGSDAAAVQQDEKMGAWLRTVPVIGIVNATTAEEEEGKCQAAGISVRRTLCKPVKKDALLEMAHECIRLSLAPAAPEGSGSSGGGAGVGVAAGAGEEQARKIGEQQLKVLVADDDAGQRLMLKAMLTKDGHSVQLVDNGEGAVKSANSARFDLIFLQGVMPIMAGWEALNLIRRGEVCLRLSHSLSLSRSHCIEVDGTRALMTRMNGAQMCSHAGRR